MPQEVEQVQTSAPVGWSGKMSPELSAPTKERTLEPSSRKPSKSSARKLPLFMSLNMDGTQADATPTWEENGALRGEFSMLSFGECPSVENASHLSQILEASPPPEILFERQGVPGYCPQSGAPWQRAAAPAQDGTAQPSGSTFCIQGNCIDRADTAGCNGKGWTEGVSYTLNTIDRPAVYSEPLDDVASTLRAGAGMPKHDADIRGRRCANPQRSNGHRGGECSSDIRKQVADVYAATCGSFMSIGCDVCPTLMARDYKQSHIVCYKDGGTENDYV